METPAGASLLLDLVNSRLVFAGGVHDELGDDEKSAAWLRARGSSDSPEAIAGARRAREAFVPFLRGQAPANILDPWLSQMRKTPTVVDGRLDWTLAVDDSVAVGARAIEEWAALQTASGSRIRPCANPDCQHFLIDNSKANSRKWHSMETCGNRMKSRRHYAKSRDLAGPTHG